MNFARQTENFVTVFDSHYLPQGLCLHRSLERHGRPYHLWAVAVDDACASALERLGLSNTTVVRLQEVENEALRSVKSSRSVGEYCWTLTPFLPSHVFQRMPQLERVTYVDADLFFFDHPLKLIDEFEASGKHILLTEHAFAPEYADRIRYGRFCVQFMTFRNTEPGFRVLRWWQDRCIEWCYAREEAGKFGDQKYLDAWPELFAQEVHVLGQREKMLAPWNVAQLSRSGRPVQPVFYHFHSLKIIAPRRVLLYFTYFIGRENRWIYDEYLKALRWAAAQLREIGLPLVWQPLPKPRFQGLRDMKNWLRGTTAWARL